MIDLRFVLDLTHESGSVGLPVAGHAPAGGGKNLQPHGGNRGVTPLTESVAAVVDPVEGIDDVGQREVVGRAGPQHDVVVSQARLGLELGCQCGTMLHARPVVRRQLLTDSFDSDPGEGRIGHLGGVD